MGYPTSTFTNVATAALDKYGKTLVDNIITGIPTFLHLKKKGGVVDWNGEGDNYHHPISFAVSPASGPTSGWKQVSVANNDFLGSVSYKMKKHYATIAVSDDELNACRGEAELINLTNAKITQATDSIQLNINSSLHAATVATDDIDSLAVAIDGTGTIGGIAQATYTWWASTETGSVGSFAAGGIEAMQTMCNTLRNRKASNGPDLIVTTQTIFQYYQNATRAFSIRDIGQTKIGDLGVPQIEFEGIPIIWDPNCTSGVMYFINSKGMQLVIDSKSNMKMTEFVKPADQMGKIAQMYIRLQLVMLERRACGKLTGISA
jgi:hypothetical protein